MSKKWFKQEIKLVLIKDSWKFVRQFSQLKILKLGLARSKYTDGISLKKFEDYGVKKLFLLAVASGSQENYENVELWKTLDICEFNNTVATDLKFANVLVGIMSHSSNHPWT